MLPLPSRGASAFASRGLSVQLGKGVSHSTRVVGLSWIKGSHGDIWSRPGLRKPRLFPPPTPHLTHLCGCLLRGEAFPDTPTPPCPTRLPSEPLPPSVIILSSLSAVCCPQNSSSPFWECVPSTQHRAWHRAGAQ